MKKISTVTLLLSLIAMTSAAEAKVIQILHTNDLHAALKTAGAPRADEPEFGGWAQIKTVMDRLTASAQQEGIETIRLDAGDFFEGTTLYFPDHGKSVLKAFQHMGYDAAALGNHDWLMGARSLDRAFGESPFSFPILSANVKISNSLPNLKKQLVPTTQIERDGVKIGVVGLSTDEALYKWITRIDSKKKELQIVDYRDEEHPDGIYGDGVGIANKKISELRRDNDVVIALTHLGYQEDQDLAAHSQGLDLIIGGHSHTMLESMNQTEDRDGRLVPIVQTGYNGKFIGRILLDIADDKTVQVLTYELVQIPNDTAKDPTILAAVNEAHDKVQKLYTPARLNEVIGKTEVRLISGEGGPTAYSKFVVDAMKDITGADIGLDIGAFHGNTPQAAGDITRLKLMEMYPRKFEVEQNEGLYVYQARIPGWIIALGLKYAVKFGTFLSFSGLTFDVETLTDEQYDAEKQSLVRSDSMKQYSLTPYRASGILVNGEPLRMFRSYTVAMPESLLRGAWGISSLTKLVITGGHPTPHTIWDAMNHYLYKVKTIRKIHADEQFTSRAYSNRYQKQRARDFIREQFDDGEGIEAPWVTDAGSLNDVITDFFREVQRRVLKPEIIFQEDEGRETKIQSIE